MTELLRLKYLPHWLGLGLLFVYAYLPRKAQLYLGKHLGQYMAKRPKRRHIADCNLRHVLPGIPETERIALRNQNFRIQGQCYLDYGIWLFRGRKRIAALFDAPIGFDAFIAQTGNKMLITIHNAALDAGTVWMNLNAPITGMAKNISDPFQNWLLTKIRKRFGAGVTPRGTSMKQMVKEVKQGRVLYYLPDEDLGLENSVFSPLFGREKATLTTVGKLAKLCDASVAAMCAQLDVPTGKYRLFFLSPIADFPLVGQASADCTNTQIEALITNDITQYIWSLKYFRTQPTGFSPVY